MGKKEIIIGAFLMALSAAFYGLSFQFPKQTLAFSPKIFPRFVSVCLFLASSVLTFQGVKAVRKSGGEKVSKPLADRAPNRSFLIRLSLAVLIAYAYTRLLSITGYIVATPPFIAGTMLVFNEKRWLKIVLTSVITTTLLYVLFRMVFRVPLPRFSLF